MILSDRDILKELAAGNIACVPFDRDNLSNSSLDLRLGQYIVEHQSGLLSAVKFETNSSGKLKVISSGKSKKTNLLDPNLVEGHKYMLYPGKFILAQTLEVVGHPNDRIISQVLDKSTLARLGLSVCFSAGYIDAGNVLSITLEIKNNGNIPIELQYGMHICQLRFQYLSSPCLNKYDGKYKNASQIQSAK